MGMVCAIESDRPTFSSSLEMLLRHRSLRNIKWPEVGGLIICQTSADHESGYNKYRPSVERA